MPDYLNPYHFVPVKPRGKLAEDVPVADMRARQLPHQRHDRYVAGPAGQGPTAPYSGRLVCRLTTMTPTFVGGERTGNAPALSKHFEVDGRPAIPDSTLTGLLSSMCEAASNSAPRVLDSRRLLSYRKGFGDTPLSAIGELVDVNGSLELRPLTLPTCAIRVPGRATLPREYDGLYPDPSFRAQFGTAERIREEAFGFETTNPNGNSRWAMKLLGGITLEGRTITWSDDAVRVRNGFAYAMGNANANEPVAWSVGLDGTYTKGLLRVLGCVGETRKGIPKNKKHELFIPYPDSARDWPTIPIAPDAVERFEMLADERTRDEVYLPFEPRGRSRNADSGASLRLQAGDLVFFRPEIRGKDTVVAELSFSSIWRGRVETLIPKKGPRALAGIADFFRKVDADLVPFSDGRKNVTIAEQMWGFVELRDPAKAGRPVRDQALALKARVRVSTALLEKVDGVDFSAWAPAVNDGLTPYEELRRTRILGSPKPPCPAMYFKPNNGTGFIEKRDLRPGPHWPQGRKMYLHGRVDANGAPRDPWHTEAGENAGLDKQKTLIAPVKPRAEFWFHIDFDNLSEAELNLLCYAVSPTPRQGTVFWHKLGMAKNSNLGSVSIEATGLFLVDRGSRYSAAGYSAPRYRWCWRSATAAPPARLSAEVGQADVMAPAPSASAHQWADRMDPDIRSALELLGDPNHGWAEDRPEVRLPHWWRAESPDGNPEDEAFRWFVRNERGTGRRHWPTERPPAQEVLAPLDRGARSVQALPSLEVT